MCSAADDPTFHSPAEQHGLGRRPDVELQTQLAMSPAERAAFLAAFTRLNPAWRGAEVADILQSLSSSDSDLAVCEPIHDDYGHLLPEAVLPYLSAATRVVTWSTGERNPDRVWPLARELAERAAGT